MVFTKNYLTWCARHVSIMTFISQKIRESDFWSKGTKGPYQESQYRITTFCNLYQNVISQFYMYLPLDIYIILYMNCIPTDRD